MTIPLRRVLNMLTKPQLIKLGKKYGIVLTPDMTKIGMGSRLMIRGLTDQIRNDALEMVKTRVVKKRK